MTVEAVRAKVWREDPAWSPQVISQTATYFVSLNNPTLWLSPSSSTCSACSACLLCLRHSYPSFKAPVKAHLLCRACSDTARRIQVTSFSVFPQKFMPTSSTGLYHIPLKAPKGLLPHIRTKRASHKCQCLPSPGCLRDFASEDDPAFISKAADWVKRKLIITDRELYIWKSLFELGTRKRPLLNRFKAQSGKRQHYHWMMWQQCLALPSALEFNFYLK